MTYRKSGCGGCSTILEEVKRYERINENKAKSRTKRYSSNPSASMLVPAIIALGAGFTIATILMKK